jgi:hypothetical protein
MAPKGTREDSPHPFPTTQSSNRHASIRTLGGAVCSGASWCSQFDGCCHLEVKLSKIHCPTTGLSVEAAHIRVRGPFANRATFVNKRASNHRQPQTSPHPLRVDSTASSSNLYARGSPQNRALAVVSAALHRQFAPHSVTGSLPLAPPAAPPESPHSGEPDPPIPALAPPVPQASHPIFVDSSRSTPPNIAD